MSENETKPPVELALITGLSGSGKSTVAKCFEDLGYYCVDNLPTSLLRSFLRNPIEHLGQIDRVAVVTDVRAPDFASEFTSLLEEVDPERVLLTVLYLEASDESLVRRFSETRRRHPLARSQHLIDAISEERQLLADVRSGAGMIFDTSEWSIHDIRRRIYEGFSADAAQRPDLLVWLTSFGFKHGIPYGSDLLFDVRFLSNPYFEPSLRTLTGADSAVQRFLEEDDEFEELLKRLEDFLLYLLPLYQRENRSYLSVSVGCTGGRHRSVAVCERLSERLTAAGAPNRINHRDIDRESSSLEQ